MGKFTRLLRVILKHCFPGFGHALAKRLDRLGFVVIAGCLDPNSEGANVLSSWSDSGRIHVVPLDVTKDDQVQKAVEFARENCPEGIVLQNFVTYMGHL